MSRVKGQGLKDRDLNLVPDYYQNSSGLPYLRRMKGMHSRQYYNVERILKKDILLRDNGAEGFLTLQHKTGYRPYIKAFWKAKADTTWKIVGQQKNNTNAVWVQDITPGSLKLGYYIFIGATGDYIAHDLLLYIYNQECI